MSDDRAFQFLQGPPGPLFYQLGREIASRGVAVHRINLSGGDQRDWPKGAHEFRGHFSEWPVFVDHFLRDHAITDLILFGDCRPYHVSAHGIAALREIRTHVLEEGYLRPDWMTLELGGVNARSPLTRDKDWFLREAKRMPPEPERAPITASFRRRANDSYWHYHYVVTGRLRFPHYHSHRSDSLIKEGFGWLWKLSSQRRRRTASEGVLRAISGKAVFVFPLQLSGDYQIRTHSPFPDMQSAARFTFESFAEHAPADTHLLVKVHPLDCSFFNWDRFVSHEATRLGLTGRIHFVDGGDLEKMVTGARGLVCVNSTSATLALAHGTPVCAIGEAVYDMVGLTHQGHVDTFWAEPTPPEPGVYDAFKRVLVDRCLVFGGLASQSAVRVLIGSILNRLGFQTTPIGAEDSDRRQFRRTRRPAVD